ncbi:phosphotransferase enzyme family protein [Acinetobacter nectaris]|uniref:phosphotransferase enzyme family protein n=1 Tax=Acinetobacter nectaris TaxID=1219382 RepID=UPI001F33CCCF|nr:phosphotransferase [Acinetobacter nectaris]MCF9045222.1 phosphotransferase [Acinetobacter nectaris]
MQNEILDTPTLYALAEQAMQQYDLQYQGKIKLLCQSENATFVIQTPNTKYALRLHRPNYHSKKAIQSELLWLDALTEHGISVPQAITNKDGEYVLTLKYSSKIERHAVLFNWVQGEMPTTDVDPKAFKQLGSITAQLHQHSKQWQRPDHFNRIIWNHDTMVSSEGHWGHWADVKNLTQLDKTLLQETVHTIGTQLKQLDKSPQYYGLIHADLRLTNLLLQDNKIGVIDFDDCGLSWFMHDLAAALSFNEHLPHAPEWVDQWLDGYEQHAHISQLEYALIPSFIMQRRIQMLAWTGSHADTEMTKSLGDHWIKETTRLCKQYLKHDDVMPLGAA